MKKGGYFLFFLVALTSCQKSPTNDLNPTQSVLTIDRTSLTFPDTAASIDSFTIQSNISWSISIAPSTAGWLKTNKNIGNGNDKIYVTTLSNNTSDSIQKATVTIHPINNTTIPSISIAISQKPTGKVDTINNVYGGTAEDEFVSAVATTDGGYIAIGNTISKNGDVVPSGHGQEDIWVVKTDTKGRIVWQKTFGGSDRDFGTAIIKAYGGGYLITGSVISTDGDASNNHGGSDTWLAKIDDDGNIIWKKMLGGSGNDDPASISQTSDGGYIIVGSTSSNNGDVSGNHGGNDGWVLKIDSNGNKIWQKALGGTGFDALQSVKQTPDGGYITAGYSQSNNLNVDGNGAWVNKLDVNGNLQWQKSYSAIGGNSAMSIVFSGDGGYLLACATNTFKDAMVIKIDINGNSVWQKIFGGANTESVRYFEKTLDNNYILSGETRSPDIDPVNYKGGDGDGWVIKIDASGNQLSQKLLGGSDEEWINFVIEVNSGNYIGVGTTFSKDKDIIGPHGYGDAWLMRFKM